MTQRTYTNRRYLDALKTKVLVFDGAMGTSLQMQHLTADATAWARSVLEDTEIIAI